MLLKLMLLKLVLQNQCFKTDALKLVHLKPMLFKTNDFMAYSIKHGRIIKFIFIYLRFIAGKGCDFSLKKQLLLRAAKTGNLD